MKIIIKIKQYKCKYCREVFNNKYSIAGHYNLHSSYPGYWKGKKLSKKHKEKLSLSGKGKHSYWKDKKFSKKHKEKISLANKGCENTWGYKISKGLKLYAINLKEKGIPYHSKEAMSKIIRANEGNRSRKGSKHTKQAKFKMRKAHKRRVKRFALEGKQLGLSYKRCKKGKFYSCKNQDFIRYDSSYELKLFEKLEDNTDVKQYMRCPYVMDYKYKNKSHIYHPDLLVEYINGKRAIIEVKPKYKLKELKTKAKFNVAKSYCKQNSLDFQIITEKELFKVVHLN